jgi:hypothetical protein
MKTLLRTLSVAGVFCAVTPLVYAQQVPLPTTAAQVPGSASGTVMTKPYVQMVARMTYFWGWPLVQRRQPCPRFFRGTRTRADGWGHSRRI